MGAVVRGIVACLGLALVVVMLVDWNGLVWTGAGRATNDAQLRGQPVVIEAQVAGLVTEEAVGGGVPVRRGQLLFRIEDDDARAALDQARATAAQAHVAVMMERAQAFASAAQIDVARHAAAASDARLAFARLDAARWNALTGGAGELRRETQQSNARLAAAQSDTRGDTDATRMAEARRDALAADAAQAEAQARAADHAVTLAEIDLGHTAVVAPADGRVTERVVHVGKFVGPGRPMIDFVPPPGTWALAWYREEQLAGMAVGQPVQVHVDAYPELALAGCVAAFSPTSQSWTEVVPPSRATGNFTKTVQRVAAKVTYATPHAYAGRLIPGLSIETRVLHGPPCVPPPAEQPIPPRRRRKAPDERTARERTAMSV